MEYTILKDRVSKIERAGMQMFHYPTAPPSHAMALISGIRVMRVLCETVAASCCVVACAFVGVATECARIFPTAPGSASTKRFSFLIMPKRRECAKSASASNIDLNARLSWLLALEFVMINDVPLLA